MTTRASPACKDYVRSRVDSQAIILVLNIRSRDDNACARTDVKAVGVVTQRCSCRIINSDVRKGESSRAVNGKDLHWAVEYVETGDGGFSGQVVGVEELWLGFPAVSS